MLLFYTLYITLYFHAKEDVVVHTCHFMIYSFMQRRNITGGNISILGNIVECNFRREVTITNDPFVQGCNARSRRKEFERVVVQIILAVFARLRSTTLELVPLPSCDCLCS